MSRCAGSPGEAHRLIRTWYEEGLRAVDPADSVREAIRWEGDEAVTAEGRLRLAAGANVMGIAIGKAAAPMAAGLQQVIGSRLDGGVILTKDDHASEAPTGWDVFEAGHPVPDSRGVEATRRILGMVKSMSAGDVAVCLISGGGSALLEAPRSPITLDDIRAVTNLLLRAGAPIQDLNAVRSELSEVKGGGLRRSIGAASCVSLILSDVLGNDPAIIASGPTILREPQPERALDVLDQYGLRDRVPRTVIDVLTVVRDAQPPIDARNDIYRVVGDNRRFIDRIEDAAREAGCSVRVVLRDAEGEASDMGRSFARALMEQPSDIDCVLGGGEATVTVRGDGIGGRNTEFALAAALELDATDSAWVVASLASDGQDGSVDAAGAIADRETVRMGREKGLDARRLLADNDSGRFFREIGTLVAHGPTGTNVNDVYMAVRVQAGGHGPVNRGEAEWG